MRKFQTSEKSIAWDCFRRECGVASMNLSFLKLRAKDRGGILRMMKLHNLKFVFGKN